MVVHDVTRRRLHWLVAALIAGQYVLQGAMHRAMARLSESNTIDAIGFLITTWHSLAGMAVGAFMIWRWTLRKRRDRPPGSDTLSHRWVMLADAHHRLLYCAVLLMVASGLLNYYADVPMSGEVHGFGKWLLAGLIMLHVLAAFWHHFVRQDNVLRDMIGITRHADTMDDR